MPIAIPQRIDSELLKWLDDTPWQVVIILQVNHLAELNAPARDAIETLKNRGIPLLSQSVLLSGINDSTDTLAELFESLTNLGVIPYYLHQLDRVAGAGHFEVPVSKGVALIEELREQLPGYAVPRYVQEIPGKPGKVVLA